MSKYVYEHHERWDGKGYPKKLKREEISIQARIIGVADAYDAMTCDRTYRKGLSQTEAIYELRKNAGTQFDPEVTRVFIEKVLVDEF
jgi:HD-GYP domain-containing protein (c-di-GMP phosphodiesterase class II)